MVRRHPLAFFYLLAVAIVAAVVALRLRLDYHEVMPSLFAWLEAEGRYPNVVSLGRFALEEPRAWLIFVFASAPTVAALVTAWVAWGRGGVADLLSRLRPRGRAVSARRAATTYGWILGVYLAVAALYLLSTVRWIGTDAAAESARHLGPTPLLVLVGLLVGALIDEGSLLEELGWRGFALPLVLDRFAHPLAASLALGLLWWAWHLPRELPGLLAGVDAGVFLYGQSLFLLVCLALSILMTWGWVGTGGSVWPAFLIHGGTNVWSKALGGPLNQLTATDLRTWIVVALALGVLVATGGRLGIDRPVR